ncbi:MAG TPA: hypothetical protein VF778_01725 [Xanthobacteraceae bacterium]
MLAQYVADTQNLLNDAGGQFFPQPTLHNYINRARRRVAAASGCVRVMIRAKTHANQEEYKFSEWTALAQQTPGVREVLAVRTLAIAIGPGEGAWKPVWNRLPFSDFQTRFRIWNHAWIGTISYPGFYAQYGFGISGSVFLAPIPSQIQPMELDTSCMPFPLSKDNDAECIPYPWVDAVAYYAAVLCMLQQQRKEDAAALLQIFQAEMPFAASVVAPNMITAPYGSAMRSS